MTDGEFDAVLAGYGSAIRRLGRWASICALVTGLCAAGLWAAGFEAVPGRRSTFTLLVAVGGFAAATAVALLLVMLGLVAARSRVSRLGRRDR